MALGAILKVNGAVDGSLSPMEIEVIERIGQITTYRLRLGVVIADGDLRPLADARLDPGSDVAVVTEVAGKTACLARGPVQRQIASLTHGGAGSFVDVFGGDAAVEMDREEKVRQWADVTDSDVVSSLMSSYALTPDVEDTKASHDSAKHSLVQRGTDLQLIRRLARRNGYLFWIDWDETGEPTGHFRKPPLDGAADAELTINLDRPSFQKLTIEWDAERPVSAAAAQIDMGSSDTMDGSAAASPLPSLGTSALGAIAQGKQSLILTAAVDDGADLTTRAEAALSEASFFVRASGATTTFAASALVRAHRLVRLSGVGARHSGLYLCAGVRHVITSDAHSMDVELIRNGWGAA